MERKIEEVLLYELEGSIIKRGRDNNYPFCRNGSQDQHYIFKKYLESIFKYIGLSTHYENYMYDFSIIKIELIFIDKQLHGKVIFENEEVNIILDDKLTNIYDHFIKKNFFGSEKYVLDSEKNGNVFKDINEYINIRHKYHINIVLCEMENNKLTFYGYCLKDILKICRIIGYNIESVDNFDLYSIHPLLSCLFYKLTFLWYRKKNLDLDRKRESRQIQHILTESVEMLYSKLNLPDLDCINVIASLSYESEKCSANLVFVEHNLCEQDCKNSVENEKRIQFKSPVLVEMEECRKIRKYLQMAQGDMNLVARIGWHSHEITELVPKNDKIYDVEIKFKGHMKWELRVQGRVVLEYENGQYRLLYLNDKEKRYKDKIKEYLQCSENNLICEKMINIIAKAEEQNHGAIIIFTNKAKEVSKYYCECGRGIEIEPVNLLDMDKIVYNLTTIDGALIVNHEGICYGIGIILDGQARMYSNPGRGARYNSAYTFIANKIDFDSKDNRWINQDEKYVAVVISEDNTVDIITNTDIMTPYMMEEIEYSEEMNVYDEFLDSLYSV